MKRIIAFIIALALSLGAIGFVTACNGTVEIIVASPYDEADGNRANFVNAYKDFEKSSGYTVKDKSKKSDENGDDWKTNVKNSFKNKDTTPDVLFFFTGTDADELVKNGEVVPIRTIQAEDSSYASNMKSALIPVSTYDSQSYAVPVNGYWEGMYVNTKVLDECGIALPGQSYTWQQFLLDCEVIKQKGYDPIAFSFGEPHYMFEFCVFNNGSVSNHLDLPSAFNDDVSDKWKDGIGDIKQLYEYGFFPDNAPSQSDACRLMAEDKAAFLIDGSWRIGYFETLQNIIDDPTNPEYTNTIAELKIDVSKLSEYSIDNYAVTYVPAYEEGERKPTEIIGGISMGYYITKKAWNDSKKRKACIEFVKAMTTDEVVNNFGALAITALKNGTKQPDNASELVKSALAMTKGCTGIVEAVQDSINTTRRNTFFADLKSVAQGTMSSDDAIKKCFGF